MAFFFLYPTNELTDDMSLSEIIAPLFFCFGFFEKKKVVLLARAFHFPTRTCVYATCYIFVDKMQPPQWSAKTSPRESGVSIINYI